MNRKITTPVCELSARKLFIVLFFVSFSFASVAQTIWNTGNVNFSQTAAGQYDAITPQTHLGRTTVLNNFVCQNVSGGQSCSFNVCNTQWAYGSIANWNTLTYNNLYTVNGCTPPDMIGRPMVLHLLSENIYLQVTFNSWTAGSPSFSYTRTTGSTLPVLLSAFTGSRKGTANALSWTTSTEINSSHFNVQRSTNGTDYTTIGRVGTSAVDGNSSTQLAYTYSDTHPATGNNYYRLEQVDRDGQIQYSPVVKLVVGATETSCKILQNPVTDRVSLAVFSPVGTTATIKVLSVDGLVVKNLVVKIDNGDNNLQVPVANVPAGLYVVQVYQEGKLVFTGKVAKQ